LVHGITDTDTEKSSPRTSGAELSPVTAVLSKEDYRTRAGRAFNRNGNHEI